jgi:hypothetical protein
MAIKENLDELMERKMDRGEFLRMAAITLAGIIGIARFIGALNQHTTTQQGYGSGTYGGAEDRAKYLKTHKQ